MKFIFTILLFMVFTNNVSSNDNLRSFIENMTKLYMDKIKENNGMHNEDNGVYTTKVTYENNKFSFYLLYNKKELIESAMNSNKYSYIKAKDYIESKQFKNKVFNKQKSSNIVAYCNPNDDNMTKAIRGGLKIYIQIDWDNGINFMKYNFSQEICDDEIRMYERKRKIADEKFIKEHENTLYKLGLYPTDTNNKIKAIKMYIQIKENHLKPKKIIEILGKDLYFGKELNDDLINEHSIRIMHPRLYNGKYIIIQILKIHESKKEKDSSGAITNIKITEKDCIKYYGYKTFKSMQDLDIFMNDIGNAFKRCKKDIGKIN